MAGANTFVHHHADWHTSFENDLAAFFTESHLAQIAHRDEKAGRAEIVAMVVNVVGADAGEVGDAEADMEGAGVDDGVWKHVMLIQKLQKADAEIEKPRHGEQQLNDLVGAVFVFCFAVAFNVSVYLFLNGKDVVGLVEVYLIHGAVVLPGL